MKRVERACLAGMLCIVMLVSTALIHTNAAEPAKEIQKENSFRFRDGVWLGSNDRGLKTAEEGENEVPKIIDVSKWQGEIDWQQVKDTGVEAALIRCGVGMDQENQDDPYYEYNVSECERLGIPYGVYIYSFATDTERAISEADHVIRLLKGKSPSYPVFYDIEDETIVDEAKGISNQQITNNAKAFINRMKSAGYYDIGIYSSKYYFETKLTGTIFGQYPKWVAQYHTACTYQGDYCMWQYTKSANVPGISGNVDGNEKIGGWIPGKLAESVTVSKKNLTLFVDGSVTVNAKVQPEQLVNPTIFWKASNANVTVSKTGKITAKAPGTSVVTASTNNNKKAVVNVTVRPKKNTIKSIKKTGKTTAKLTWSKINKVTGYEVWRSTKASGNYKKIATTKASVTASTNKKLKKGIKYYYKVRSYKKVNEKKIIYSNYSPYKSIKL